MTLEDHVYTGLQLGPEKIFLYMGTSLNAGIHKDFTVQMDVSGHENELLIHENMGCFSEHSSNNIHHQSHPQNGT
jgi:hypothetical protein